MLPPDWRDRMALAIRGQDAADLSWFATTSALSPAQQLGVYREQFTLRMRAALRENLPGLRALLPDAHEALFDAYVADHPPRSWTLERVGAAMPAWLEARGAAPAQVDMARVDLAIGQGFLAREPRPLRPEDLAVAPALALSPPVTLLRLRQSVHRFRGQVLGGEAPDPLVDGPFCVVIYRMERRMRHIEMPPLAFALLGRLELGLEAAIATLLDEGADVQELSAGIPGWFRLFAERGLVEPASPPPS